MLQMFTENYQFRWNEIDVMCTNEKLNKILWATHYYHKKMSEATSKGGLSRFSVSRSSKQTDRKLLINNDQGVLLNQKYKLLNKAIPEKPKSFFANRKHVFVKIFHTAYQAEIAIHCLVKKLSIFFNNVKAIYTWLFGGIPSLVFLIFWYLKLKEFSFWYSSSMLLEIYWCWLCVILFQGSLFNRFCVFFILLRNLFICTW